MTMSANKSTSITSMGQVLLLLLSMFCGSCDWNRSRFVPSELIGVWKTDDVRYRGRSLELSVDTALIETGSDEPGTEAVESVKNTTHRRRDYLPYSLSRERWNPAYA